MKIGGASLDEDLRRIEAVLEVVGEGRQPGGRRQRPLRPADRDRLCQGAQALRAVLVRGGRRSARLRAAGGTRPITMTCRWRPARICSRTRMRATCCAIGGMHPERDWLQFDCALVLRPGRISAHARGAGAAGLVVAPRRAAWRPPDVAQHRRRACIWAAMNPIRTSSSRSAASPTASRSRTAMSGCRTCRASASRRRRSSMR